MIRYTLKHAHTLLLRNTSGFSSRTVGDVEFHEFDSFTKVLLNRPKALNSLNSGMIAALKSNVQAMEQAKAVWFEGAGGKAFCAGGDVKSLFDKEATVGDRLNFFREEFSTDYKIANLKSVQIANWDGIVMGGGFGITSMAPFRIATENSMFAMPEAKLGFFTDICSCYVLSRLRSNIGFYLGMTGARLKGEDLYISGLANYFIPRKSLEAAFNELKAALPGSHSPKELVAEVLSKYH
jgi:3-hydroxyisobutyryl-CoA hydrolase